MSCHVRVACQLSKHHREGAVVLMSDTGLPCLAVSPAARVRLCTCCGAFAVAAAAVHRVHHLSAWRVALAGGCAGIGLKPAFVNLVTVCNWLVTTRRGGCVSVGLLISMVVKPMHTA
jgi:hypothetical protein